MRDRLPPIPGRARETRRIATDTTHEGAAAPEKDQTIETTPAAAPVEYSAGVVRLGDIVPVAVEPEAAPDITDSGDEDLEHKTFADFGVTDPIVDALEDKGIIHPFPIQALTLPRPSTATTSSARRRPARARHSASASPSSRTSSPPRGGRLRRTPQLGQAAGPHRPAEPLARTWALLLRRHVNLRK